MFQKRWLDCFWRTLHWFRIFSFFLFMTLRLFTRGMSHKMFNPSDGHLYYFCFLHTSSTFLHILMWNQTRKISQT
uniref:Uncharacterized protein n=1 Tax=Panstrongylus lignarius TaxID=156445 RepID=A0A224XTJ8_9HEMI